MLTHLTVTHYALIERLEIDFNKGFSVITGETGAGKSIILGALSLLLGGKAEAKTIMTGQKKCMIEATFIADGEGIAERLEAWDVDYDPAALIVRREVNDSGKSRAFINDTPVTAARLKELGGLLIDIHSQHQNLLIRNEHFLLDTLDVTAARQDIVTEYTKAYLSLRKAEEELTALREKAEKDKTEEEFVRFQLTRLDEAALQPGHQDELEQESRLLGNAEGIKNAVYRALEFLSVEEESLSRRLRQAGDALCSVGDDLIEAAPLGERLETLRIELDDIESDIKRLEDKVVCDPVRLAFVEERLATIYTLEKKHHVQSVEELIALADEYRTMLSDIENVDEDILRLEREVNALRATHKKASEALTAVRKNAAEDLVRDLTESLNQLGMPHVTLDFHFASRPHPDRSGADSVSFLFSANKNVPPQDISQIASGGEIARLMLALKAELARHTQMPVIVFDEIDTGVSGTMAEKMAIVMKQMSEKCQVICITHLPQIAALGDNHYRVYKEERGEKTLSHIVSLDMEERIEEIANMLSGATLSEAAIDNAKALLRLK